jgi:hypothetical protein
MDATGAEGGQVWLISAVANFYSPDHPFLFQLLYGLLICVTESSVPNGESSS